jgi:ABC-type protease/lipase transport system fused ATPase/permease subunit
MAFPFAYVYVWICISTFIHPWLGIVAMYVCLLTTIAIIYKATSRKTIEKKGSFDNFNSNLKQLLKKHHATEIERKRQILT